MFGTQAVGARMLKQEDALWEEAELSVLIVQDKPDIVLHRTPMNWDA